MVVLSPCGPRPPTYKSDTLRSSALEAAASSPRSRDRRDRTWATSLRSSEVDQIPTHLECWTRRGLGSPGADMSGLLSYGRVPVGSDPGLPSSFSMAGVNCLDSPPQSSRRRLRKSMRALTREKSDEGTCAQPQGFPAQQ